MSAKTKIVVLHMKEIIYTAIFVVLGILLIILLAFMFFPKSEESAKKARYTPGIYTSTLSINNTDLEVEVSVDNSHINAIRFNNLNESVAAMYPLMQPTIESISKQIYEKQSLEDIKYSDENAYTSQIILEAIESALQKAQINNKSRTNQGPRLAKNLISESNYPSTIKYLPLGSANTSEASSISSSDMSEISIPFSSKYSITSSNESTTAAIQSSKKASASSIVSATGSSNNCNCFFKNTLKTSSSYSYIIY